MLLAVALPAPEARKIQRGAPGVWAVGGALGFALLWLPLTGVVQWTATVYATPLYWAGTDSWSALTPILAGSPLPHLWIVAPWWSLPAVVVITVLVGLNLWLSTRMRSAGVGKSGEGRRGWLSVLPAGIAAPVCCSASPPLLALLGVPLTLDVIAAPFAALLSAVLLTLSLVFLRLPGSDAPSVGLSTTTQCPELFHRSPGGGGGPDRRGGGSWPIGVILTKRYDVPYN